MILLDIPNIENPWIVVWQEHEEVIIGSKSLNPNKKPAVSLKTDWQPVVGFRPSFLYELDFQCAKIKVISYLLYGLLEDYWSKGLS